MIDQLLRFVYTADFCGDFCGHLRGDSNCCHEIVTISNLHKFKRDLTAIFRWMVKTYPDVSPRMFCRKLGGACLHHAFKKVSKKKKKLQNIQENLVVDGRGIFN